MIVATFVVRESKLARSAFKVEGYILRLQYEPGELALSSLKHNPYLCGRKGRISQCESHLSVGNEVRAFGVCVLFFCCTYGEDSVDALLLSKVTTTLITYLISLSFQI